MKNFDGYLKLKLGNDYVLLAGGSHKALSDFSMSGHNHDDRYYTETESDNKYLTIATAQTVTGAKTFNTEKWVLVAAENDEITNKNDYIVLYKPDGSAPVFPWNSSPYGEAITNSIRFRWYNDYWRLGQLRGGGTGTDGFCLALENSDHTKALDRFRVMVDGTGYLNNSIILTASNASNYVVSSIGSLSGAITLLNGLSGNGSINLSMSGKQLQASIVGLGSMAFDSGSYVTVNTAQNITGIKTFKNSETNWTNGDATLKLYYHDHNDTNGPESVFIQSCFDGKDPATHGYVTSYSNRCYISLQPRGGRVGINMGTNRVDYPLLVAGSIGATSFVNTTYNSNTKLLLSNGAVKDISDFSGSDHNHDGRYLRDIELNGTFANNVIPTNLAAGLHRIHRPGTDYVSVLCGYDYPGDYWLLFFQTSSWITPTIQYRATNCTDWITLLTSLNSSVSGGGSTWGSSITVKINGTTATLTIPSNPDTWRGITDDYTGTSSTISLSLKGGKSMYDVLLNGYATWAGGLSSVLPQLAASGEANEVVFSRDLCNGTESSIGYFEKGIRFRWYSNYINIGNVRGGSSNLYGFCIAYSTTATGNYNVLTRVTTGGDYYVAGNSYSTNFYTTSDARKKQNIHKISDNIKQFEWKETGETSYGFVAQDLEVKHPELVNDDGNMKTVNYNAALSLVVAKLENRVKELEAKLGLETPPLYLTRAKIVRLPSFSIMEERSHSLSERKEVAA